MKVGKTTKVLTAPKREIRKATKKEEKIPVKMPEKVPAEAFHYIGNLWGGGAIYHGNYLASVTS